MDGICQFIMNYTKDSKIYTSVKNAGRKLALATLIGASALGGAGCVYHNYDNEYPFAFESDKIITRKDGQKVGVHVHSYQQKDYSLDAYPTNFLEIKIGDKTLVFRDTYQKGVFDGVEYLKPDATKPGGKRVDGYERRAFGDFPTQELADKALALANNGLGGRMMDNIEDSVLADLDCILNSTVEPVKPCADMDSDITALPK